MFRKLSPAFKAALLCSALLGAATPALAQDDGRYERTSEGSRYTADAAREAVREGRHRPLREVVRSVAARYPGSLVDVLGLEERGPNLAVYRLRWRTPDGRLLDLNVDAETGAVIR